MLNLDQILETTQLIEVKGNQVVPIRRLCIDSRLVESNSAFIAIKGTQADGHNFIDSAIGKGAKAIVCQEFPSNIDPSVTYIKVPDCSHAAGTMASAFYGHPSQKLTLVGVTGTNGKTTTATLLYQLSRTLGHKAGLLSTITNYIDGEEIPSTHTTPDPISLNALLALMVAAGCTYCFMEVSSHAIVQNRIAGLSFAGGIFTNITHDHLDYHHDFGEYIKAKKKFFDQLPANAFALTNIDDRNGRVMVQNTEAKVSTYSIGSMANFRCHVVDNQLYGMQLELDGTEVWSRLIGKFNAYNLLAVYSTTQLMGFDKHEVLTNLSAMGPVNGRFEHLRAPNGVLAVVDYAHTPDAVENVVQTLKTLLQGDSKLITVLGAGGNRDKTKRPAMAHAALSGSSLLILTSDNPRFEDPNEIICDMRAGMDYKLSSKVLAITDRREAIRTACVLAAPGDIVLIAGKGHETYQEIRGVKHHFDDKEEVEKIFNTLKP